jgi:hypothetical protein
VMRSVANRGAARAPSRGGENTSVFTQGDLGESRLNG